MVSDSYLFKTDSFSLTTIHCRLQILMIIIIVLITIIIIIIIIIIIMPTKKSVWEVKKLNLHFETVAVTSKIYCDY